jgi:hypothetical protein
MRRFLTALMLLVLLGVFQAPPAAGEKETTGNPKGKPVELPSFYLAETKGKVHLIAWDAVKKQAVKEKAKAPRAVKRSDRVVTGKNGHAYLQFKDGGTVEVGPDSDMFVQEINVDPKTFRARFLLTFGRIKATVKKLTGARSAFEVESGGVVAGVRGTTFEVEYDPDEKQTVTKTYEGQIYTRSGGVEKVVKAGFSLALASGSSPVLQALGADDIQDFVEFLDVSGGLEKKKQILLKQLEKQLLKKLTEGVLDHAGDEGKNALRFGF